MKLASSRQLLRPVQELDSVTNDMSEMPKENGDKYEGTLRPLQLYGSFRCLNRRPKKRD